MQLDLFEEQPDELALLRFQLKELQESHDKVRKSLFARHNELSKLYLQLRDEIEVLKFRKEAQKILGLELMEIGN